MRFDTVQGHRRRATVGDAYYGPACPRCSNPKHDQSLHCQDCFNELQSERAIRDNWAARLPHGRPA